ncbi:MAG: GntR family transcriptional regulator [Victivallaceae bacterium]|nr:GntR family transcriptional regulator [Victivallaceae bacterium]
MNAYRNKKEKFKESLLFQIASGNLKLGDRIPSERSFCKLNHLSRVTVRNALAELEREKIIEKRDRRGIFVCGKPEIKNPRAAKAGPRKILYIFFPSQPEGIEVNTGVFGSLFRGIDKYVNMQQDIAMLLQGESFLRCSEEDKRRYDGFIVGGISLQTCLPEILKLNIPTVVAASFAWGMEVDIVSIDFHEGGYVAAKKLDLEGCRNLLFLGIEYEHDNFILQPLMEEKYRGISDYCLMNNLEKPILYNVRGTRYPTLDQAARRKLVRIVKTRKIDGIICSGNNLRQVIDCLKSEILKRKYPLPKIAVFNDGTEGMSGKEFIQIYKDLELCGFCAAEMLYERFSNPYVNTIKKLIPVKLPVQQES